MREWQPVVISFFFSLLADAEVSSDDATLHPLQICRGSRHSTRSHVDNFIPHKLEEHVKPGTTSDWDSGVELPRSDETRLHDRFPSIIKSFFSFSNLFFREL